jgi:hypothetical protein
VKDSDVLRLKALKLTIDGDMRDALDAYYRRLRLQEQPEGEVRFGFWYPAKGEHRPCCDVAFKKPLEEGRQKDWNVLQRHCRTVAHVAALYSVDYREMMELVKEIAGETR